MPLDEERLPASPAGEGVAPGSPPAEGAESTPAAAPEAGAGAAPAAGKDEQPKSVLDAVLKAVNKEPAPASAGNQPPGLEAKPEAQPPAAPAPEGGDKPLDKLLGKEGQERIRALVGQVKTLEPKARYFDQMSEWVSRNGLTSEDVSYALELIKRVKNDPASAAELLDPLANRVRTYRGEALPQDLQEQVDAGTLNEQSARELAARRAQDGLRAERDARARAEGQVNERREQAVRAAMTVGQAVSQWERDWQAGDPDYGKKQKFVSAKIAQLMQDEGAPENPEQAVALAKRAREEVEKEMAQLIPPSRQVIPPTGGATRKQPAPPSSSLDAARQGLERSRQAA